MKVFVRKWSKFDRQNSVIDSLLDEIDNKKERRKYLKIIQIVPDIGDLDLENKQIKIVEITKRQNLDLANLPSPPVYNDTDNDDDFLILPLAPPLDYLFVNLKISIFINKSINNLNILKMKVLKMFLKKIWKKEQVNVSDDEVLNGLFDNAKTILILIWKEKV